MSALKLRHLNMRLDSSQLVEDFEVFTGEYFRDRAHFGCNYGSYATGMQSKESDIDVFFAVEYVKPEDVVDLTRFIVQYHLDRGLKQDEEVPYDNKLVVSYDDVESAVKLYGLETRGGRIHIPPVVKDKKFLSSLAVRYRLIFNALTSPHNFVGRDRKSYEDFRRIAEESLIRLAHELLKPGSEANPVNLTQALLQGPGMEEGEMFLGYKGNTRTVDHLLSIFSDKLDINPLRRVS